MNEDIKYHGYLIQKKEIIKLYYITFALNQLNEIIRTSKIVLILNLINVIFYRYSFILILILIKHYLVLLILYIILNKKNIEDRLKMLRSNMA